jgi:hypothetical protein
MQKTSINPEILQPMFESAANAAEKGQSQYFTPLKFGRRLAEALPRIRPTILDLNCGVGHLLQASVGEKTVRLLGADIDPCRGKMVEGGTSIPFHRITYDATLLYPLLKEIGFTADLIVLNPPWRLFFYRDRLVSLAESTLPAVRQAFKGVEEGIPKGTIDSTIAMLLIALDLCTVYGEGLLIANNATLERLLFNSGAPHDAIARHIWAHVVVPGNPMTNLENCQWKENEQFHTGVIYFAREHTTGPKQYRWPEIPDRVYRQGAEIRNEHMARQASVELWQAARERVGELEGNKPKVPWNLWLEAGVIHTALSIFEKHSKKINKREVDKLFGLNGKAPMELVLQRASRDELLHVAEKAGWRVQPDLLAAVHDAIKEYHSQRAPLYPLPEIQRLGYLDEEDQIECKADLCDKHNRLVFKKGNRYPLRTQTVAITREVVRPNAFTGEEEELEYSGQELAFFISDEKEEEYCFMDAKLRDDPNTEIHNAKQVKNNQNTSETVDFTLQELCVHFVISEVPDVATVDPNGYQHFLDMLAALEDLTSVA